MLFARKGWEVQKVNGSVYAEIFLILKLPYYCSQGLLLPHHAPGGTKDSQVRRSEETTGRLRTLIPSHFVAPDRLLKAVSTTLDWASAVLIVVVSCYCT